MLPHGGEEVVNSRRRTEGLSLNEGRRRRPTKVVWQLALQTTVLAVVFTTTSLVEHASTGAVSKHDLQAKIDYCEPCHGVSGEVFMDIIPSHGLQDSKRGTSRTSCKRSSSTAERISSCLTWRMC